MTTKPYQLKRWVIVSCIAMILFSCRKDADNSPAIEKDLNLTGFNKLYAGDKFNLTVTKGAAFSVKVKGPSHSVNDIDWAVANNILNIEYNHHENNRPKIDINITLPLLVQVNLSGAGTATISGFQDVPNVVRTVLSGASKCTLNGAASNTQFDISGASELIVNGATESLYGNISGAGKLNAYDLTATEVDISASGGSEARVKVIDKLFAEATGGSSIYYKGTPGIKSVQTSGGGRVVQE